MSALRNRSHVLLVAAARLEDDKANPKVIAEIRGLAKKLSERQFTLDDERRIDRQRTLFHALPTCSEKERLKEKMLQRAYDLLWDGDALGCDALLEFLPSDDVARMLDAWERDQAEQQPPSPFYEARA
jgi:hypothetical protein